MRSLNRLLFAVAVLVAAALGYRYWQVWLRSLLLYLSASTWARRIVSSRFPLARTVANRFVAGEEIEAALAVTRGLNEQGLLVTLDYLGENVTTVHDAVMARDQILLLLDRIHETGVNANVSIKLSQLGVKIDSELALKNVSQLLKRAEQWGNRVRIDMEESEITERTLEIYRALRDEHGYGHSVGIVIQAYLYRSESDVKQLAEAGAWVRLCKGAYAEPPAVAFADKSDTDANFIKLMRVLLAEQAQANGVYLGVATHDEKMIRATAEFVNERGIQASDFEFQMLYGIRRDLQKSLAAAGYQVRVYVPYGTAWYPYLVRRLAEHPANLWFFVSNLFRG